MNQKVIQIANINIATYGGLWWLEEHKSTGVLSTEVETINGNRVIFEEQSNIKNITLQSGENGWLTKAQKEAIINFANSSIGQVFKIIFNNSDEFDVRFRHIPDGACQFEAKYEGSDIFVGTIYLSRV